MGLRTGPMGPMGLSVALLTFASSTPATSPIATIISTSTNLTRAEGETITLPCTVHNLGVRQQVVWRRGNQVLSAGSLLLTPDSRLSVSHPPQAGLHIQGVGRGDEGEYSCQVTTVGGVKEVSHWLAVRVPPSIRAVPPGGAVTGKEGAPVTLRCRASGVPPPVIQWHKSVGPLPSGEIGCQGACFTITELKRSGAGDYMCTASNGVGPLQHATITLSVLYPPVVEVEAPHVQGGGSQVRLACRVSGQPAPKVDWFRGGEVLSPEESPSSVQWTRGSRIHSLSVIRNGGREFGNYSCVATNLMGSARRYIEVHGRPSPVTFLASSPRPHHVLLRWKVLSHSPVSLFTLLYRKAGDAEWITVRVAGGGDNNNSGGNTEVHEASSMIENLAASSTYEALVQAKNSHGWSQPSKIEVIHTPPEEGKSVESLWSVGGLHYSSGRAAIASHLLSLHISIFCSYLVRI